MSTKKIFSLGLLYFFLLLTSSDVQAFSSTSMTPSTMTPAVQATYLLQFTPSVTVPVSGSIEVAMQTSFTWPASLGTSDMELTVNGVAQSLSGVLFGGYTITNPGTNQLTLTLPSSTSISAGSPVTLLLGRQANFYNPSTAGNHSFSVATRDTAGNLLESGAGIILIQDVRVGVSGEYPIVWGSSGPASSFGGGEEEEEEEVEEGEEEREEEEVEVEEEVTEEEVDVLEEPTFDLNNDGVVDITDINIILESFEAYPDPSIDYNLDGEINVQDFSLILTEYSESEAYDASYDPPSAGESAGPSSYASKFVVTPARDREPALFHFYGEDAGGGLFQVVPVSFRYAIREDLVIIHALIDTGPSGIQTADVTFTYDADLLDLDDVYTEDSVFSIWARQPYEVSEGRIRFVSGTPHAFIGSNGYIATFEFIWKQDGLALFEYTKDTIAFISQAIDLDIFFEDLAALLKKPVVVFAAEEVPGVLLRSSTHPVEGQWSQSPEVSIEWDDGERDLPGDLFWYRLDQTVTISEDVLTSSTSSTSATFDIPTDGRWYVHVLRERNGLKSDISTYELAIDRVPPLPFDVTTTTIETINGERWLLSYHAQDETSGVKEYWIQHGSIAERTKEERFFLQELEIGYYVYSVHAVDRAGNIRTEEITIMSEEVAQNRPWQLMVFIFLFLFLVLVCMRSHRDETPGTCMTSPSP